MSVIVKAPEMDAISAAVVFCDFVRFSRHPDHVQFELSSLKEQLRNWPEEDHH